MSCPTCVSPIPRPCYPRFRPLRRPAEKSFTQWPVDDLRCNWEQSTQAGDNNLSLFYAPAVSLDRNSIFTMCPPRDNLCADDFMELLFLEFTKATPDALSRLDNGARAPLGRRYARECRPTPLVPLRFLAVWATCLLVRRSRCNRVCFAREKV